MKIRISLWWVIFLPFMILSHMGKTLFFLFLMLSIHEAAHMMVARYFHYPIRSLIIYPFGLCAQMQYIGMGCVWKELLIVAVGPLTHLCFPYFFVLLQSCHLLSASYMEYLCYLNTSILIFNLLPIYPLDGGRLLQSFYHLCFRYRTAQRLAYITGIINLYLLFHYHIITSASAYLVMGFLLFQIVMCWKNLAYERIVFYHYRLAHPPNGRIRANRKDDLFRAYTNMMKTEQGWMLEDEWLLTYFQEEPLCRLRQIVL